MIIKHCEMKGRRGCGIPAVAWVAVYKTQYHATEPSQRILAACERCIGDNEVIERIA